jgi:beta-xylosidase
MILREDIQIRDPYIVKVESEKKYYLYGTTDKDCWKGKGVGFNSYSSVDLQNFEGPYEAFRPEADFWADCNFWAPEVHKYKGKYFMFASFKTEGVCRGTQILASEDPKGPFKVHSDGPVTPRDWECLDGTLYVDEEGNPWLIFCHEWVQIVDGEMHAMRLSEDLRCAVGEPVLLFRASEAPWKHHIKRVFTINGVEEEKTCYVTDGPFMYKAKNGDLLMLWSSIGREGYAMGIARSISGNIIGPWTQEEEPIYGKDGGHGMIFTTFDNELMMTIHTPNKSPNERPVFIKIIDDEGKLYLHQED